MNRQALRNDFPFHAARQNTARQHVACCYRKPVRKTWLQRAFARLFR